MNKEGLSIQEKNFHLVQTALGGVCFIEVDNRTFECFLDKIREESPALFKRLEDKDISFFRRLPNTCYSLIKSTDLSVGTVPVLPEGGIISNTRMGLEPIYSEFALLMGGRPGEISIHPYSGFSIHTREENSKKLELLQDRFQDLDWNLVDDMFRQFTGFGILNSVQALLYIYNSDRVTDPLERKSGDFFDYVEERTAGIVSKDVLEFMIILNQDNWRERVFEQLPPSRSPADTDKSDGHKAIGGFLEETSFAGLLPGAKTEVKNELEPQLKAEIITSIKELISIPEKRDRRKLGRELGWSCLEQKYGKYNFFEIINGALSPKEYSDYIYTLSTLDRELFLAADIRYHIENGTLEQVRLSNLVTLYRFRNLLDANNPRTLRNVLSKYFGQRIWDIIYIRGGLSSPEILKFLISNNFQFSCKELAIKFHRREGPLRRELVKLMGPDNFEIWKRNMKQRKAMGVVRRNAKEREAYVDQLGYRYIRYLNRVRQMYSEGERTSIAYLPTRYLMKLEIGDKINNPYIDKAINRFFKKNLSPEEFEFWLAEISITSRAIQSLDKTNPDWRELSKNDQEDLITKAVKMRRSEDELKKERNNRSITKKMPMPLAGAINNIPRYFSSTNIAMTLLFNTFGFIPLDNKNIEVNVKLDSGRGQYRVDFLLFFNEKDELVNDRELAVRCLVVEPHFYYRERTENFFKTRKEIADKLREEMQIEVELWILQNDTEIKVFFEKVFKLIGKVPSIRDTKLNVRIIRELYLKQPEEVLNVLKVLVPRKSSGKKHK